MKKKRIFRVISGMLCLALMIPFISVIAGCSGNKKDSIVIMTEELSGLFNPFYATTGTDQDVVGMTQISMLSIDDNANAVANDTLPTVVKDFEMPSETVDSDSDTVYTFVIKNGIKFSDGKALTMNDVMFNLYVYLDPVYTGSSTMYSTKIKGLKEYRTQSTADDTESIINQKATVYADNRMQELKDVYQAELDKIAHKSNVTIDEMKAAINSWEITDGYKEAVGQLADDNAYRAKLMEDYEFTMATFKKELESDFKSAKTAFDTTAAPYNKWADKLNSDVFKFFLYEGYITPKYGKDSSNKEDKSIIESFDGESVTESYSNETDAINRVYNDKIEAALPEILTAWGTASTLITQYTAEAKSLLLSESDIKYKNISGIVSLGHTTDVNEVEVNGKTYKVAHNHNSDGTPVNSDEYDVLRITVEGADPKAIFNFGFTVAPAHYYSADSTYQEGRTVDIANNKFGVDYASANFQTKVLQSAQHVEVPVGAGPFKATDRNNNDNPSGSDFNESNIVYFKANKNFMFEVKAEKLRMQVANPSNALDKLKSGEVDYVTPQFTSANAKTLNKMVESGGFEMLDAWQLGYGYIGINAGLITDINMRKAIMAAMQTSLATQFYEVGTSTTINWPMSTQSWAYPYEDKDSEKQKSTGIDYLQWEGYDKAVEKVRTYLAKAQNKPSSITFTIAGASITEHPTYNVFRQAVEIIQDAGYENVKVQPDSQALTKLSTGSLEVWAAAWGSSIDPDMYQVYHKNSTATSVNAWGYREIKKSPSSYVEETKIINDLSDLIDEARSKMKRDDRTPIYEEAMQKVLELAVEMPVYQRKNLYAYNSKTITGINSEVNPFTSPLERIWELELVG